MSWHSKSLHTFSYRSDGQRWWWVWMFMISNKWNLTIYSEIWHLPTSWNTLLWWTRRWLRWWQMWWIYLKIEVMWIHCEWRPMSLKYKNYLLYEVLVSSNTFHYQTCHAPMIKWEKLFASWEQNPQNHKKYFIVTKNWFLFTQAGSSSSQQLLNNDNGRHKNLLTLARFLSLLSQQHHQPTTCEKNREN